jgi:7-carboxy-7-deazaguanine synthase
MMTEKLNRLRITDYDKILPIHELYYAIQSEGSRAGRPTVVVRTTGCTHRCWFGEGGWCDAWRNSVHPEKGAFTFNDIIKMYNDRPGVKEMMLTGGSPTMHPEIVNELTIFAYENEIILTMETEGSHFIHTAYPIDLISLSPKFSNSIPSIGTKTPLGTIVDEKMINTHNRYRLNIEAIRQTLDYHSDYHFKPVCNPIEMPEVWEEIIDFSIRLGIPKSKIWIMPPGDNREELVRVYPMVMDFCTERGYNFTGREHIIAYDTKRGV